MFIRASGPNFPEALNLYLFGTDSLQEQHSESFQGALEHSESIQRALRESNQRAPRAFREQLDFVNFVIQSEPKILRLVMQ